MSEDIGKEINEVLGGSEEGSAGQALSSSEAPISASVTGYYKGYSTIITLRDPSYEQDAYRLIKAMQSVIDVMDKKEDWNPSWNQETNKQLKDKDPDWIKESDTDPDAPICGIHNKHMTWKTGVSSKTGKPYAFWSCSGKMPDGSWCKYKPDLPIK